jgi:hypothetical protein
MKESAMRYKRELRDLYFSEKYVSIIPSAYHDLIDKSYSIYCGTRYKLMIDHVTVSRAIGQRAEYDPTIMCKLSLFLEQFESKDFDDCLEERLASGNGADIAPGSIPFIGAPYGLKPDENVYLLLSPKGYAVFYSAEDFKDDHRFDVWKTRKCFKKVTAKDVRNGGTLIHDCSIEEWPVERELFNFDVYKFNEFFYEVWKNNRVLGPLADVSTRGGGPYPEILNEMCSEEELREFVEKNFGSRAASDGRFALASTFPPRYRMTYYQLLQGEMITSYVLSQYIMFYGEEVHVCDCCGGSFANSWVSHYFRYTNGVDKEAFEAYRETYGDVYFSIDEDCNITGPYDEKGTDEKIAMEEKESE